MVTALKGWLKTVIVYAGCRQWLSFEATCRLIQFFRLKHV